MRRGRTRRRPSRRRNAAVRLKLPRGPLVWVLLLVFVIVVAFEQRDFFRSPVPPPSVPSPRPESGSGGAIDYDQVEAWLASIEVRPEIRRGYARDDWPHWIDADGDCLNTREEVLIEESLEPVRLSADGCSVLGGLWRDVYTGETFRNPRDLDVDHVVALQETHDSGGHTWDRSRRIAYANDLSDPRTLKAVSAAANRAKAAYGPEEWLPPDPTYRCRYVADWIAIKARWRLAMDESERVAVGNILADCRARAER